MPHLKKKSFARIRIEEDAAIRIRHYISKWKRFNFFFDQSVLDVTLFRAWPMDIESDWDRCAAVWARWDCITGGMTGPMLAPSAPHRLCEEFASRHPESFEFLLRKLYAENPIVAGYAFKCLIRVSKIDREDLPADILSRPERVQVQQGGCVVQEMTLGQYFRGYWGLPLVEELEIYHQFRSEDQLIEIANETADPSSEYDVAEKQAVRNILARRLRDDVVPPRSPSA